jgi:hypothetical protein
VLLSLAQPFFRDGALKHAVDHKACCGIGVECIKAKNNVHFGGTFRFQKVPFPEGCLANSKPG